MKLVVEIGIIKGDKRGVYKCPICKNEFETSMYSVKAGRTTMCRTCSNRKKAEKTKTHGEGKGSKLYNVWLSMRYRCSNENVSAYKHYGGKGIKVCEAWENDYASFKQWCIKNGYKENDGLSIDRVNPDDDYKPSNCRIISMSENSRRAHTRDAKVNGKISVSQADEILILYYKDKQSMQKIADKFNVTKQSIWYVINQQRS